MIKDFLRYWLGVQDQEGELEDLDSRIDELSEDLDSTIESIDNLQNNVAFQSDVDNLRSRVRELEGVGGEFTNSEWSLIQVLLDSDEYVDVSSIAEDLDTNRNNARAILNNVKDKVDLDVITRGRKKVYRVPEDTRKEIFS